MHGDELIPHKYVQPIDFPSSIGAVLPYIQVSISHHKFYHILKENWIA
jgi:hypothetical protein